jgi:hypothetical protein
MAPLLIDILLSKSVISIIPHRVLYITFKLVYTNNDKKESKGNKASH